MKDNFKPYTKDLQLESWWYILKYADVDSVYMLDTPNYYMLNDE